MKIYYALNYEGSREESRRLLGEALARYTRRKRFGAHMPDVGRNSDARRRANPFSPAVRISPFPSTGQYWAVLMDDRPCGLDIQKWQPSNFLKLAFRFYNKDEYLGGKRKRRGGVFPNLGTEGGSPQGGGRIRILGSPFRPLEPGGFGRSILGNPRYHHAFRAWQRPSASASGKKTFRKK